MFNRDQEVFKPLDYIQGFEGLYMVSNQGRFFSIRNDMYLKEHKNNRGYEYVKLWNNGKQKTVYIHQAVARCFLPNPLLLKEVDHISQEKHVNAVWNLRWCTSRQNKLAAIKPNATSGYRGVSWYAASNKWRAEFSIDNEKTHLGYFDCKETAARVYDCAVWFSAHPLDRPFIHTNFQDWPFLQGDDDSQCFDTQSIDSDDTENGRVEPPGMDEDSGLVEVSAFDAESDDAPPFHDRRVENTDREIELT